MEQEHKLQNEDQAEHKDQVLHDKNTQEIDQEECELECDVQENKGNKQTEIQTLKLNTPFGDIEYRPDLKLSRASIVQLLVCYVQRLSTQKPTIDNKWQELAYPKLFKIVHDLKDHVIKTVSELYNDNKLDKEVVTINFCGYTNFKLPLIVQTQGVHHRATYATVNVRPFLKTIEQRLTYLSTADVPARYRGEEKKVNTFRYVQDIAKQLLEKNVLPLYDSWKNLCQEAADYAGIKLGEREPRESEHRGYRGQKHYGNPQNYHRTGQSRQYHKYNHDDDDNQEGYVVAKGKHQYAQPRRVYRGKYTFSHDQ